MSWCGGKVCCAIYREKVYCRRGNHADEYTPCNCRHARYRCEVEACEGKGVWCPGPGLQEAEASWMPLPEQPKEEDDGQG